MSQIDNDKAMFKKRVKGLLDKNALLSLQSIIIYFVTRTLLPRMNSERATRRKLLSNKDMVGYSNFILKKETEKEELTKEYSALAFKMISITPDKYYESMLKINHTDIMYA